MDNKKDLEDLVELSKIVYETEALAVKAKIIADMVYDQTKKDYGKKGGFIVITVPCIPGPDEDYVNTYASNLGLDFSKDILTSIVKQIKKILKSDEPDETEVKH